MYDRDKGLGEAMGRSHDREVVANLAAIVLKAISGIPVTPAEMDALREIAAGDKIPHTPVTEEQIQLWNDAYSKLPK